MCSRLSPHPPPSHVLSPSSLSLAFSVEYFLGGAREREGGVEKLIIIHNFFYFIFLGRGARKCSHPWVSHAPVFSILAVWFLCSLALATAPRGFHARHTNPPFPPQKPEGVGETGSNSLC